MSTILVYLFDTHNDVSFYSFLFEYAVDGEYWLPLLLGHRKCKCIDVSHAYWWIPFDPIHDESLKKKMCVFPSFTTHKMDYIKKNIPTKYTRTYAHNKTRQEYSILSGANNRWWYHNVYTKFKRYFAKSLSALCVPKHCKNAQSGRRGVVLLLLLLIVRIFFVVVVAVGVLIARSLHVHWYDYLLQYSYTLLAALRLYAHKNIWFNIIIAIVEWTTEFNFRTISMNWLLVWILETAKIQRPKLSVYFEVVALEFLVSALFCRAIERGR